MAHLAEGTLQEFMDDELPARHRSTAAEHLLVCGECRGGLDELKRVNAVLVAALADLDEPAPAAAPPPARRRGRAAMGGGALLRAAVLILVAAAAASASVRSSPLRSWIAQVVAPDEVPLPETAPPTPSVEPAPAPAPVAAPAGLAVPGGRHVDVVVTGLREASIRLVRGAGSTVAVSARGGSVDPAFRMGAGRIEVLGGTGGELLVELPAAGSSVRLVVDGTPYAAAEGTQLRVLHPAEQDGEALLWP